MRSRLELQEVSDVSCLLEDDTKVRVILNSRVFGHDNNPSLREDITIRAAETRQLGTGEIQPSVAPFRRILSAYEWARIRCKKQHIEIRRACLTTALVLPRRLTHKRLLPGVSTSLVFESCGILTMTAFLFVIFYTLRSRLARRSQSTRQ